MWSMMMLMAMMFPLVTSCGGDDDDEILSLESYIIGTWHSYKAVVKANGNSQTVSINKTGENSTSYYECDVKSGGKAVFRAWVADANGILKWAEESCTYRIKGDVFTLIDSSGGEVDLVFESSSRNMVLMSSSSYNGTPYTVNIYFTK